ncbi:VOC family protein [Nocardioides mangrovicus]|uniref:VOC family protein n=1 Tax=Nocardioides mangrovicus TaxID=2478913 RepID=A0A3L8P4K5_9ACTN|nr:VOC family protein [Nocardioides mangrovicus]RLV49499.1 VOC family protein [Nocardioides mangrovicus]
MRRYPHGVPCWVDVEQPDAAAGAAFYGELLGWTFEEVTPAGAAVRYLIASLGGRDAAAIGSGPQARWHTFVAVDDADETTARLRELGATIEAEPVDAGPGGRAASARDPEGHLFHLWQARRRPGAQAVNEPGAWNFSDLHTADPEAARAFYGSAFGWRFAEPGPSTAIEVPGYGDHLESTVDPGIRTRQASAPPGFADVVGSVSVANGGPTGWRVTFAVADRDDAAARAERLGATVLTTAESEWTRTASIRDPQGAELVLSQFTPHEGW